MTIFVPGRLVNPLNGRKGWRTVWASSRDWRRKTATAAILGLREPRHDPYAPRRVSFHASVWRLFDDEGLIAACKPLRDALGPATAGTRTVKGRQKIVSAPGSSVIHSDAPDSGHEFVYSQVVDRKRTGVEITVSLK